MQSLSFSHSEMIDAFSGQLDSFVRASQDLDDMDLLQPSLCQGWSRLDLVVHVRVGLEEMVAGCLTDTPSDPDHDAASYWGSHCDDRDADPVPHILWLRRTASAYGRPCAAVRHLEAVSDRVRRVLAWMPEHTVAFQGHGLSTGDFLATWVVELTVHHLDLGVVSALPTLSGLHVTQQTVEAIAMSPLPTGLSGSAGLLTALGRTPWPEDLPAQQGYPVHL